MPSFRAWERNLPRLYLPEQDFLLPPSLGDWLPENHSGVFRDRRLAEQLDLSAIEEA